MPFITVTKKAAFHRCVQVLHSCSVTALYERVGGMERRKGTDLWLLWMDASRIPQGILIPLPHATASIRPSYPLGNKTLPRPVVI